MRKLLLMNLGRLRGANCFLILFSISRRTALSKRIYADFLGDALDSVDTKSERHFFANLSSCSVKILQLMPDKPSEFCIAWGQKFGANF